jgi:hypothetical protein
MHAAEALIGVCYSSMGGKKSLEAHVSFETYRLHIGHFAGCW